MNYSMKIPEKVKRYEVKRGQYVNIDTMGLCCVMQASDKDVFVKANKSEKDADAFKVSSGTSLDFCSGNLMVFSNEDTVIYCMFYSTL